MSDHHGLECKLHGLFITKFVACKCSDVDLVVNAHSQTTVTRTSDGPSMLL